jgi:hypothetical protein
MNKAVIKYIKQRDYQEMHDDRGVIIEKIKFGQEVRSNT